MSVDTRVNICFLWHMHQPEYRDTGTGAYQQPWVYLHAIKDYVDMVAHLESEPSARVVVNFSPILLDQLNDYNLQVQHWRQDGIPLRDPLLAALSGFLPITEEGRSSLVNACLRANRKRLIAPFLDYVRLVEIADRLSTESALWLYLNDNFVRDILVWYHLAWLGETVRRSNPRVQFLISKGRGFTDGEARELLSIIGDLLGTILERYKRLAINGQVELSCSPYAHPIVPLLIDFRAAKEAQPEIDLPLLGSYPGGLERARAQINQGIRAFEKYFGFRPKGCWLSEGGVSDAAFGLLDEAGFIWSATGNEVLRHSLEAGGLSDQAQRDHQPYCFGATKVSCFFRDDRFSDLIGFSYADWHADDAVANFVAHLEGVARTLVGEKKRIISVILDGENAWEYYPNNGYYFLSALYKSLSNHPLLRMVTFAEHVALAPTVERLEKLVAGSWVYGTFSTWVGNIDKNRAWDLLIEAKVVFDRKEKESLLDKAALEKARQHLSICEGSDWFWWYGDYNPADAVGTFDTLFRSHLRTLYTLMDEPIPDALLYVVGTGSGAPERGGVMKSSAAVG